MHKVAEGISVKKMRADQRQAEEVERIFFTESLILAQDERWRRA